MLSGRLQQNCSPFQKQSIICQLKRTFIKYYSTGDRKSQASPSTPTNVLELLGKTYITDNFTNIPRNIVNRLNSPKLFLNNSHPIGILSNLITEQFPAFRVFNQLSPIVPVRENFDALLFPPDHPGRLPTDTYYINKDYVLRTHNTAHDSQILKQYNPNNTRMDLQKFFVIGDVYRRDEIDSSHYPAFHQLDAVKVFNDAEEARKTTSHQSSISNDDKDLLDESLEEVQPFHQDSIEYLRDVTNDLRFSLNKMVSGVLSNNFPVRWVKTTFPFTSPSWEMEVYYEDKWLEICGCGILKQEILDSAGLKGKIGWAFGLGLERLAMPLFQIPDIRLFWSTDERFSQQFQPGKVTQFQPFSKFPPCVKDISFWLGEKDFHINDLCEIVRDIAKDLVEDVKLVSCDYFIKRKKR